jgi:hypothetical protein
LGQSVEVKSDDIEDFSCDVNNPYYRESLENSVLDDNGQLTSEFFAELVVNESNFLGVTVTVSDWNKVWSDPKERLLFYLMESCAMLADFALY